LTRWGDCCSVPRAAADRSFPAQLGIRAPDHDTLWAKARNTPPPERSSPISGVAPPPLPLGWTRPRAGSLLLERPSAGTKTPPRTVSSPLVHSRGPAAAAMGYPTLHEQNEVIRLAQVAWRTARRGSRPVLLRTVHNGSFDHDACAQASARFAPGRLSTVGGIARPALLLAYKRYLWGSASFGHDAARRSELDWNLHRRKGDARARPVV